MQACVVHTKYTVPYGECVYVCKCMHHVCRRNILLVTSNDVSVQVMAALHSVGSHHQVGTFIRAPSVVLRRVDIKGISLPRIRSLCDEQCTITERCSTSSLQTGCSVLGTAAVGGRTPSTRIRKATKRLATNTVESPTAACVRDKSAARGAGHKAVEQKSLLARVNCPNTRSNQCEQDSHHNSGKRDTVHKSADSSDEPMRTPPTDFCGEGNLIASPSSSSS